MKNLITLTILCLALLSRVNAQELSLPNNNTDTSYRLAKGQHELGLGIDLNQDEGAVFSVNHRYALLKNLHLRSQLYVPNISLGADEVSGRKHIQRAGASIGLEQHFPIGKRWSIYAGVEVGATYSKYYSADDYPDNSATVVFTNAFAGVKYYANKRLSFFAEASYGVQSRKTIYPDFNYKYSSGTYGLQIGAMIKLGKL